MIVEKKVLGIIGGLGPLATAYFMKKIIYMTDAKTDQEHIKMIIYNFPDIPDRTKYILDKSAQDPLPCMRGIALRLQNDGVSSIAIPCVTAQFYHDRLQESIDIPIFNGVQEMADYLKEKGIKSVGILGTDGTVKSDLFGDSLRKYGIKYFYPSSEGQKKVMSIIYDSVKAGNKLDDRELIGVADELRSLGAERIILGCTELSVIKEQFELPEYFIDVLDVMARSCVSSFSLLRKEYETL